MCGYSTVGRRSRALPSPATRWRVALLVAETGTDTNDYVDALTTAVRWDHVDCDTWAHWFLG